MSEECPEGVTLCMIAVVLQSRYSAHSLTDSKQLNIPCKNKESVLP